MSKGVNLIQVGVSRINQEHHQHLQEVSVIAVLARVANVEISKFLNTFGKVVRKGRVQGCTRTLQYCQKSSMYGFNIHQWFARTDTHTDSRERKTLSERERQN